MRTRTNYRSPSDVLDLLNCMLPSGSAVSAGSPLATSSIELVEYVDSQDLFRQTTAQITRCIRLGFSRDMIAMVTLRGREHSAFGPIDRLGPHSLKAFTGAYDLLGSPIYSPGDIVIESVLRFKGQAAPCIILAEVDFETLDEKAVKRLFVGATRATMKLVLVASARAARQLRPPLLGTGANTGGTA